MCPRCGDAMYLNEAAACFGGLDMWQCFDRACGTVVTFKPRIASWSKRQVDFITRWPQLQTLDEELEERAESIYRWWEKEGLVYAD